MFVFWFNVTDLPRATVQCTQTFTSILLHNVYYSLPLRVK